MNRLLGCPTLPAVEETSNAMALDGIMFEGVSVRVRRPNDYNPAAAASPGLQRARGRPQPGRDWPAARRHAGVRSGSPVLCTV